MGSPCTPPLEGLTFRSDSPKYQVSSQMVFLNNDRIDERKTSVSKMKMCYLALSPRPQIPFLHTPGQHILRARPRKEVRGIIQTSRAHLVLGTPLCPAGQICKTRT